MDNFYAFHKSVLGHLHQRKGIVCEDRSESENGEVDNEQFYIVVVADGHGDAACMRSATGAAIAVGVAKDCLLKFAKAALSKKAGESIKEQLENGRHRDVLKPLTDSIVLEWSKQVDKHLEVKPLTEDDLNKAGSYAEAYQKGEKLRHIYGTTLLAALLLPDYLILLQQGDGRCVVFYKDKDGTPEQPITLDERCHENVTTSMCDEDAPVSLLKHSVVIPLHEKKVMSCWLGCDGVEDSYRNDEGIYTFYRELICKLNEQKNQEGFKEKFEKSLDEYLKGFSEIGSGDDISVGGIVDMDCIGYYAPSFALQVEAYGLTEELERLKNKQISMSRKHGLLKKQAEEAEKFWDKSKEISASASNNEKYYDAMMDAKKKFQEAKTAFDAYDEDYETIKDQMEEIENRIKECGARRGQLAEQLAENGRKKKELKQDSPIQPLKQETIGQRTDEAHGGTEMRHLEILNRELVSQRVAIILLAAALVLALLVLLFSIIPKETVSAEQYRGIFDRIFGK